MDNLLSPTAQSCIFTMHAASANDPRQKLPDVPYLPPDAQTRLLRARLILEEALETISALGCRIVGIDGRRQVMNWLEVDLTKEPSLLEVIDGCCDLIYVATGCLVAFGVPDLPHLAEVCAANDRKFPGGVAITDPETGKFLKPAGWTGPDHWVAATQGVNWHDLATGAVKGRLMEQIQPTNPGVNEP